MESSKERLLRLMIRQLQYYDMNSLGVVIAEATGVSCPHDPSDQLAQYVQQGIDTAAERLTGGGATSPAFQLNSGDKQQLQQHTQQPQEITLETDQEEGGLIVEPSSDSRRPADRPNYSSLFITRHQGPCISASFSPDGYYVATGSTDSSIKLLDVERMERVRSMESTTINEADRPVIRTLYDHTEPVNDVQFHPNGRVLASGSEDKTIKFFDLQRSQNRRSFRSVQDSHAVRSISFHPSGDYLLVGTSDGPIRLYDISTLKYYSTPPGKEQHRAAITQLRYSHSGNFYASASRDGSFKVWDTLTGQCIFTQRNAHDGDEVSSVQWSRNGRYLLTCGRDSTVRLWSVATSNRQCVISYDGAVQRQVGGRAVFDYSEEYVLSGSEVHNSVVVWCARTGRVLDRISGHTAPVRHLAASPCDSRWVSCSEDQRGRFYQID